MAGFRVLVHSLFNGTATPQCQLDVRGFSPLAVTIYYWWGEHQRASTNRARKPLRVMQITTVMVVILLAWSAFTLYKSGYNPVPLPTPPQHLHFSKESLGFLPPLWIFRSEA